MEIDNNRIASIATYVSGQSASVAKLRGRCRGASKEPSVGHVCGADRVVSLTGQAHRVRALTSGLESQPVVVSQRVAAARSGLEQGTFVIDPERIADKLMGLGQALTDAG